jgi:hypothetical protein
LGSTTIGSIVKWSIADVNKVVLLAASNTLRIAVRRQGSRQMPTVVQELLIRTSKGPLQQYQFIHFSRVGEKKIDRLIFPCLIIITPSTISSTFFLSPSASPFMYSSRCGGHFFLFILRIAISCLLRNVFGDNNTSFFS